MSKWKDEFSALYKDTTNLKRLTEELKKAKSEVQMDKVMTKILTEKKEKQRRAKINKDILRIVKRRY